MSAQRLLCSASGQRQCTGMESGFGQEAASGAEQLWRQQKSCTWCSWMLRSGELAQSAWLVELSSHIRDTLMWSHLTVSGVLPRLSDSEAAHRALLGDLTCSTNCTESSACLLQEV